MYGNEAGSRRGDQPVRRSDRGEVFVTSKLNNDAHRPDDARRAFDESLKALGSDYVDLFLIHWPLPTRYDGDYVSTWKTLEEFYRDGRARSIGVSNFQPHHLRRLHQECEISPGGQPDRGEPVPDPGRGARLLRRAPDRGRGLVAARHGATCSSDPTIDGDRAAGGKTPAQVILRWHIERGDIVFPKSVTP